MKYHLSIYFPIIIFSSLYLFYFKYRHRASMWQRQHAILVCIFLLFFQCFFSLCFLSFIFFISFLSFFSFLSFLSFFSFLSSILKIFQGKYLENFSKTLKFSFEIFSLKIFFSFIFPFKIFSFFFFSL